MPRYEIVRIESGKAGHVSVERLRRVFDATGGRVRVSAWWNGAAADRLLDERHASLVERALRILEARGWQTAVEVTYSHFGERGSIDILAWHPVTRSALICEVKSVLGSVEETNRMLDAKVRLATRIVHERFAWVPANVSRLLILPAESTVRRQVAQHERTMSVAYPSGARDIRRWLRRPAGVLCGLWFLSERRPTTASSASRRA